MNKIQKVTVQLPSELLARAQRAADDGVTGTIRKGLELVAAKDAYDAVRALRGKLRLELDVDALREDRSSPKRKRT